MYKLAPPVITNDSPLRIFSPHYSFNDPSEVDIPKRKASSTKNKTSKTFFFPSRADRVRNRVNTENPHSLTSKSSNEDVTFNLLQAISQKTPENQNIFKSFDNTQNPKGILESFKRENSSRYLSRVKPSPRDLLVSAKAAPMIQNMILPRSKDSRYSVHSEILILQKCNLTSESSHTSINTNNEDPSQLRSENKSRTCINFHRKTFGQTVSLPSSPKNHSGPTNNNSFSSLSRRIVPQNTETEVDEQASMAYKLIPRYSKFKPLQIEDDFSISEVNSASSSMQALPVLKVKQTGESKNSTGDSTNSNSNKGLMLSKISEYTLFDKPKMIRPEISRRKDVKPQTDIQIQRIKCFNDVKTYLKASLKNKQPLSLHQSIANKRAADSQAGDIDNIKEACKGVLKVKKALY